MLTFAEQIVKFFSEYRKILRNQETAENSRLVIDRLGLHPAMLKGDDDIVLYQKAKCLLVDLELKLSSLDIAGWYSGIELFHQEFSTMLANYRCINGRVLHKQQAVSSRLVKSIQLISIAEGKLSAAEKDYLCETHQQVMQYGLPEQKVQWKKTIAQYAQLDVILSAAVH